MGRFIQRIFQIVLFLRDQFIYILYQDKRIKLNSDSSPAHDALVLGNGPSLRLFLEANGEALNKNNDFFVCNGFVLTDYYEKLKPSNYSLLDPLYFNFDDERVKNGSIPVFEIWEAIFTKTKWSLNIYVALFDTTILKELQKRFKSNDYIKIINLLPITFKGRHRFSFYNKKIGLVGGMTVVHLSLQMAILKKYKNIFIAGADHDWCENIKYDTDNNKVYLLNKHFYGETRLYYSEGVLKDIDLQIEFDSFSQSLKGFKDLQILAKMNDINVYRVTKSFLHFIPFKNF